MEKKQLLLISKNDDFITNIRARTGLSFELTSVKSIHAGYSLALSYLPDVILIDYTSMSLESVKNLQSFKSTHFLNRSYLFLYGETEKKKEIETLFAGHVDEILYDSVSCKALCKKIEDTLSLNQCLTNYWKDSFMGLFNLLGQPVVLLQQDTIIAMNDAFKKYFFIKDFTKLKITDLVHGQNKTNVLETLKNFSRGKHMKATATTSLMVMNNKIREAKITFSKLDKSLSGQLVMFINFSGTEFPINKEIGTASKETENYFSRNNSFEDPRFTKREKEIISLLCKGYKTREISETLCISPKTIEKHRSNIIRRTNSDTMLESIVYALNNKMIEI